MRHARYLQLLLSLCLTTAAGCSGHAPLRASLGKLVSKGKGAGQVLRQSHFARDRSGALTEEALARILAAPVFLESGARVGVLPVATAYAPDPGMPVAGVASALSDAMQRTGYFEVATEVSADWPADRGTAGLRELAARYRAEYLLLYRHRFVERTHVNAWGWGYLTLVGALFVPATTLEVAGVLEATLFEVKSGTLLFTVQQRVHSKTAENIWNHAPKKRARRGALLTKVTGKLADKVVDKIRRLVVARRTYRRQVANARADRASQPRQH